MRKVWFGLVGLALVGLIGIAVVGCGTTAKTLQAAIDAVTQVGTSEVTLSGSIIYSSGSVDINLNAVLVSGEPISLTTSKVKVRVGSTSTDAVVATPVTVTIPTVTDRPMDMVFILDNTGSMAGRIRAVKAGKGWRVLLSELNRFLTGAPIPDERINKKSKSRKVKYNRKRKVRKTK